MPKHRYSTRFAVIRAGDAQAARPAPADMRPKPLEAARGKDGSL